MKKASYIKPDVKIINIVTEGEGFMAYTNVGAGDSDNKVVGTGTEQLPTDSDFIN